MVERDDEFGFGEKQGDGHFGGLMGVIVQVVDGDVGKFAHQGTGFFGNTRPGDDERAEAGEGIEPCAGGPSADE